MREKHIEMTFAALGLRFLDEGHCSAAVPILGRCFD